MPTVTLSDLQNRNFTVIMGQGERIQLWTGVAQNASHDSVMLWWDSSSQRAYRVPDGVENLNAMRSSVSIAVVLNDVITALPIVVMDAQTKAALRQVLLSAITDISIP